jgi:hypothetical protein
MIAHWKLGPFAYARVAKASVFTVLGYPVYRRMGPVLALFACHVLLHRG